MIAGHYSVIPEESQAGIKIRNALLSSSQIKVIVPAADRTLRHGLDTLPICAQPLRQTRTFPLLWYPH